jgi:thiol-disulfide isomerase/thioredoxin
MQNDQANLFNKLVEQDSSDSYLQFIKSSKNNNLIGFFMFYAPWCPHCKDKKPFLNTLHNKKYKKIVKIHTYNCDKLKENEKENKFIQDNIKGYPTLKVVHKGKSYDISDILELIILIVTISDKSKDMAQVIKSLRDNGITIDDTKGHELITKYTAL